jgi:hypothetical protein
MESKAYPPPKLLLPTFTPPCLASPTFNTGISVRVCVEGEKVCRHDSSLQNFCLLEQRRRHDNKLYWHDPAVVGALPFKYTESIVCSVCTELRGKGDVLGDEDLESSIELMFQPCLDA